MCCIQSSIYWTLSNQSQRRKVIYNRYENMRKIAFVDITRTAAQRPCLFYLISLPTEPVCEPSLHESTMGVLQFVAGRQGSLHCVATAFGSFNLLTRGTPWNRRDHSPAQGVRRMYVFMYSQASSVYRIHVYYMLFLSSVSNLLWFI